MPFNVSRSTSFEEAEVLKYISGLEVIKSVVLDGNAFAFPVDRNARNVVPAGTILRKNIPPTENALQHRKYDGTGAIDGILLHSVEILANATAGSEPAPMVWFNAVFATPAIVGFTTYASALVTALDSCKFE